MKHKHKSSENTRDPREIIRDINALLEELVGFREHTQVKVPKGKSQQKETNTSYSGPAGGIRLLINDGFFKESKSLPEVIGRLSQEGFKYPLPPIAVALLRFVRSRVLVRLPSKNQSGKKVWVYVERK